MATSAMFTGKTDVQMAAWVHPGTGLPPQPMVIFIADSVINWLTPCFQIGRPGRTAALGVVLMVPLTGAGSAGPAGQLRLSEVSPSRCPESHASLPLQAIDSFLLPGKHTA